ncbi:flagellar export protein FliJ [Anaerosinus gibii]|uniref:Flagellar FliJ protein n=1 Tax=Selenobaculum gibii TaxID=3054208 RepID=A0A9Y2ETH0_9FIRM|nr:flagellar export protein FliJ [Selenobaculum gbiensis]WIW71581.1 flagellar export protein FliJ [Selenobaculum gbiensis]
MKKFKFRLTAVLKVAQIKKERAEIAFAEATNALIKEKESLKIFELELEAGLKSYEEIENQKITIGLLTSYNTYFFRLRTQIEQQKHVINEAEKKRQERLDEFQEALNKLKTIEQLKEKRLEEFKAEQLIEEQKELDEIGLQIHARAMR